MKKIRIGLLSAMLVAVFAAFATPRPTITYHEKVTGSANCQSTICTPLATTACSEMDIDYFESNLSGSQPCFNQVTLYLP